MKRFFSNFSSVFATLCTLVLLGYSLQNCKQPAKIQVDNALIQQLNAKRIMLPNGWSLTPVGRSLNLERDLPLNMVVSPSKKYVAIANNGQAIQSITLMDATSEKILDDFVLPKSWVGLAFSPDEKMLFASGGNDNKIWVLSIENQRLKADSAIVLGKPWPVKISPAGLSIDASGNRLYVVTKEDKALYICDIPNRKVLQRIPLPAEAYTCTLSPDGHELYISIWGAEKVVIFDTKQQKLVAEIPTESHPNDLILTKNGQTLLVANANENSVSVIDVKGRKVIETIATALYPNAPAGSTSNGLALSPDEKTLYVANADNNCLAVFDVSVPGKSLSLGFIPTGWYPTSVKTIGNKIFVANGKGFSSAANPKGPNPQIRKPMEKGGNPEANRGSQYIGGLFKGTISIIDQPDAKTLAAYSQVVYQNTPYSKDTELLAGGEVGNPIPMKVGAPSPIKYVFYIIKENRTYDQIFGDFKEGNGDPSLCLFPEKYTPNQHALAREFALLDNFYVDAEVSADGHNWSMGAYATDYTEKTWPTNYGGRGGTYDYEGSRMIASPKKGYIFDHCQRAGQTYRSYGEFVHYVNKQLTMKALVGHVDADFPLFDMNTKDVFREKKWEEDFDSLLAIKAVPHLSIIRLGNDHTSGAAIGRPTPYAAIADNDLAVGRLVEHLSKSNIWQESAIFVLEDDAQNGPDHVDAHRSPTLVISPYVRRQHVEHTMYSTSGVLRTIELILGVPPMSQYDAAATPLWKCFTNKANSKPYAAIVPDVNLEEMNTAYNHNSKRCDEFNLAVEDAIPDVEFNQIIWQTVRGLHSQMPAPRRSAFVKLEPKKKGEDDDDEDDDD